MKKNKIWMSSILAAAMVLSMTGCGASPAEDTATQTRSAEEYVTEAAQTLTEAGSYAGTLKVVSRMDDNEDSMAAEIAMIEEPLQMKVDIENMFSGQSVRTQTYLTEKNEDEVSMYMNYGEEWTEMSLTAEMALQSMQIYDVRENLLLALEKGQDWTQSGAQDDQVTLSGVIPAAAVYEVVNGGSLLQFSGMSGIGENYYTDVEDVPVTLVLEEETGEPVSCTLELTKVQQKVTDNVMRELQSESGGVTVQEYQVTMDISQIDEVKEVAVPAEASSAINYEKEISYNMNEDQAS
ncbi:hypothetical protein H9X85_12395 [Anaerotignum lactatifermentans]|uniref:Uncharacterized protein n=1 Tax=Anaerotignum lactatifermentans TaxID=160404 RepID=A0ABS2GEG4_9FIRM|nr:hypothetical protein [Anaerotignum lactatifermentans]MBM6830423.1 hypothetical protein [Anaerotignum lactatifermentans]MBM6878933.1 hypothetical protein [Anaerotignum lactatifermentans]MBM6951979.1 hypothetical protein [Anaerotignum lactatifermentans]